MKRNWFGILCQIFHKESSVNFTCRLERFSQKTVIFWIKIFYILFLKDTRIESTIWWKKLGRIAETEFFGASRKFFGKSFFWGKFFSHHWRTLGEKWDLPISIFVRVVKKLLYVSWWRISDEIIFSKQLQFSIFFGPRTEKKV